LKKGYKILLITTGTIITLLLILWLTRNILLTTAFERVVLMETSGKVHLKIKSLNFKFTEHSISIDSLEINFDDVYLDKENNVHLEKIVFARVSLLNFHPFELLSKNQLKANKLIFSRPDIFIVSNGVKSEKRTDPQELLNILEHSSMMNFGLLAHLGSVELRYGQIDVTDKHNPQIKFNTGSLTIYLDDFNSIDHKEWKSGRMFFSKSVYLRVVDFYKSFYNGYALSIDSLTWFSGKYDLDAHGFSYLPVIDLPDSLAEVKVRAKSMLINNLRLQEIDSANVASVNKLILNDGDLCIRQGAVNKKKKNKSGINQKLFHLITADTIIFNRNQLFIKDHADDTILFFKNLNLRAENLKLDSMFLEEPRKHFDYDKFRFSTDAFVSNKLIPQMHVQSKTISYESKWNKFILDEFLVGDTLKTFLFQSGRIKCNFSLKKLLQNKKQRIDLFMIRPYAELDLGSLRKKKNKDNGIINNLDPGNVKVVNGTLKAVTADSSGVIILRDFIFFTKRFRFNREQQILNYDSVYFNSKHFTFIKQNRFTFSTGNIKFDGTDVLGNNILFSGTDSLQHHSVKQITIKNIHPDDLVFNNRLTAKAVSLTQPASSISLNQKAETDSDSAFSVAATVSKVEQPQNFTIDVKNFTVDNGSINLKRNKTKAVSGFYTKYNMVWHNVKFGNVNDRPLSNLNGLEVNLWDTYHFNNGIRTDIDKTSLKSDNGYFGVRNLKVTHYDSSLVNKLNLRDVSAQFIGFKGFDFHEFLKNDKVVFGKLYVNGVVLDLTHYLSANTQSGNRFYSINLSEEMPFDVLFDSVELHNLHVNYLSSGLHSETRYKIGDFHFISSPGFKQNSSQLSAARLIASSKVNFDSLQIVNDSSGFNLNIGGGNLFPSDKSLTVTGINLKVSGKNSSSPKTIFITDTISVTGLTVSDSMPASVATGTIKLSETHIQYSFHKNDTLKPETDTTAKMAGLYRFSKILKQFKTDTVLLEKVNINYRDTVSPKKSWSVNNIHLMVTGLKLLPEVANSTLPVEFNNLFAELKNRNFITGDSLYKVSVERLAFNSLNNSFLLDSLYVTPLLDTIPFFNKHHWQTDRINVFAPRVTLLNFDLERWNKEGVIRFGQIEANNMKAGIYRDKSYPRDSLIRPLLQEMLLNVKQPFIIDTISINNAFLQYSEKVVKSDVPGNVFFTGFNIKAINITNRWNPEKRMLAKIFADGKLMGKSKIEVALYFPLNQDQTDQFWFTARSEKIDLTTLNPMTQNLSGLTIMNGKGSIDIPLITANDTLALGTMMFKYRTFKVSLYNRKKATKAGGISVPLVNFVVNNLVLRSNNPALLKRPRVGIVYFERDRNKSIINYIWKSTLSGVLSTMGFNNKEQRKRRKEYRKQEFDVQRNAVKEEKYGK